MSDYNPNDFVSPNKVRSPYSGETSMPTFQNYVDNGKEYEQAVFTDPVTGHIIKKGIVSIKDQSTGETIVDYNSVLGNSNTSQHRG